MRVSPCLVAVSVAIGLAACGGTHRKHGAGTHSHSQPRAVSPALAILLPASASGPTTCTVYEPGYATQVVFDSQSLNVTGECQAWTSRQPGSGYLWSYQPTDAAIAATAVPACHLRDPSGRVTAIVVDDAGFAPLTASERQRITSACASLTLAGWIRSRASRTGHPIS